MAKITDLDAMELASECTVKIRVKRWRELMARLHLAQPFVMLGGWMVGIGARIAGMQYAGVEIVEGNEVDNANDT